MKNDMRITYPLWEMGFIAILMGLVFLIGRSASFEVFDEGGFMFTVNLPFMNGIIVYVLLLLFVILAVCFIVKVGKHNKRFPKRKISLFSFKPQEYMNDDELFQEVTRRATQKVYSFFSVALPVIAVFFMMLPIPRIWMILGILSLSMFQYLIYYTTIRKYVAEEDE